jgi:hypothetical protein
VDRYAYPGEFAYSLAPALAPGLLAPFFRGRKAPAGA